MSTGPDAETTVSVTAAASSPELASVPWRRWFWPFLIAVLVLDQVTKSWLFGFPGHTLRGASNLGPINGFPEWIERSYNPGVAWGVLHDHPNIVTAMTILLVPLLCVGWWRYFRSAGRVYNIAFGAILGGAIGNGIDRFQACCGTLHGVRDFIMVDLHPIGIAYVWPTFNIADAGISVGFVLLAALAMGRPKPVQPDRHAHVMV